MTIGLTAMVRKEFRQVLRDPRTLGILLLVPLMLLVLFGYAVSMDVENLQVGLVDADRSAESREVSALIDNMDLFTHAGFFDSSREAELAMVDGRLDAVVVLPRQFGRDLSAGRVPTVQILVDGSNVTVASTAQASLTATLTRMAVRTETASPVDFRPRTWYNPELRSTVFLVPGLVAFIMVITAVISTALSVVREKEKGTMELLEVSPLSPAVLILGKTIPYMVISLVETTLILLAGRLLFGVEIHGDPALLLLVTTLFLLSCLGIGLFISTAVESQQTAFLLSTVVTVLPSFILSGFVFPIRNMPLIIRLVTNIVPARHFLEAERAIIIRGAGFESIWPQAAILALFSAVGLTISGLRLGRGGR